ncbi:alpha/beta hydrolase [Candidatus Poriferisodalis multihospitum]|uniref:alpha/beta hydrolase n=1 Tax=Candidatus Poriferisodalis multihospitum TaxID=2983191 RepID=UPI002B25F0DB|nr:alpha/beta hydrolase [Candidatus Poriferisodalis multihospitum]
MAEQPALVLLHGLGANRFVWDPLIGAMPWDGAIVVPDLRGHGGAEWRDLYSFGAMAADVAEVLADEHRDTPYVVLGHSMGGIVGLALASGWFGPPPVLAATIGVKLRWSDEELGRIADLASRPPREFPDRDGAVEWFMKLAGLYGVFDADDKRIELAIEAGVMRTDTELRFTEDGEPMRIDPPVPAPGWCAAQDPATVEVGPPDMAGLLAAAKCTVAMAIGEHDPLVASDHHADLAAFAAANPHAAGVTAPLVFASLGHNAMVEDPQAIVDWLATLPGFADVL